MSNFVCTLGKITIIIEQYFMILENQLKIMPPSIAIPKWMQGIMKFVDFMSPFLSIRIAARLFVSPINYKTPKREIPMLESSQKEFFEVQAIQKKIQIYKYGYSDKKVLLVHGWSGRGTQLFAIANKLLELGYMVISFDGPSHQKSEGKTTNLTEFISTVQELHEFYGPFVAGVGHSFGSMALLNANASTPIVKCLVTVGSGDFVSDIMKNFMVDLGLPKNRGVKLQQYFENKWKIAIDEFASSKASKKIQFPTLVVHDMNDGDVSVRCAYNIRKNLKRGSLLLTNNLGHTKILRNKQVIQTISEFIIQNT